MPTIADVQAEPFLVNTRLGRFTTPCNLLDLCAIALPAGRTDDGLPFGVALHAPAFHDHELAALAARLLDEPLPIEPAPEPDPSAIHLVVAGAHLSGQPLNHQLVDLAATLVASTTTSADYRLYALDTEPPKPGLVHTADAGEPIEVEVWSLSPTAFATFVAAVPAPLAIGAVTLADGTTQPGFTCMPHALDGAKDITDFGGWRAYRSTLTPTAPA